MKYKITYLGLKDQYKSYKSIIFKAYDQIFNNSSFILRKEVYDFEKQISKKLKTKYAVGLNSGTDALFMAIFSCGIRKGDEVITVSHTPVMTISAIKHVGANPIFIDIADDFNIDPDLIEESITKKTKAILIVHLHGRSCDMHKILKICKKYNLKLIEDCAQSIGARYNNKYVGSFGDVGCFSLHPVKTLNVPGDGGFITTNQKKTNKFVRLIRDHGLLLPKSKDIVKRFGVNSRLDNMHAAVANIGLKNLNKWIKKRRVIANFYIKNLKNIKEIQLPEGPDNKSKFFDTYNSFVILSKERDKLRNYLNKKGIEALSLITKGIHLQKNLNLGKWKLPKTIEIEKKVISLPIYPSLSKKNQKYIIECIRKFYA